MISLFIDTSLSDVSIALLKDGKLISNIHKEIPGMHSVYVTKYLEDILNDNNISPTSVNEIIVVNGPGSFTGIRIGVTIAKMYAYLCQIRIVTITSLKARVIGMKEDYLLSKINAKHGNYYVGLYDKEYNKIFEKFLNSEELNKVVEEYHPKEVDTSKEYDIEEIVKYMKKKESQNPHGVNPIYLKLPEAMEKK